VTCSASAISSVSVTARPEPMFTTAEAAGRALAEISAATTSSTKVKSRRAPTVAVDGDLAAGQRSRQDAPDRHVRALARPINGEQPQRRNPKDALGRRA